jgi:Holliday junction resolvase RusA-like endonuclease
MAVGDALFDPALRRGLADPDPDLAVLFALVIEAFNRETHATVDTGAPSQGDRQAIAMWLRRAMVENDRVPSLYASVPRLSAALFDGLESKVSFIRQVPCSVCGARALLPAVDFSLRISPVSRQALRSGQNAALGRAVAAALEDRNGMCFRTSVCLRIVYLLGVSRRERIDVDNLAKGTLDALEGVLYKDDSQIAHLDLVKLRSTGDEENVGVHIRPTEINDHAKDTFRQDFDVEWGGTKVINLEDYLEV